MLIYAFEGIDGSGKGTQAQLMYERLLKEGRKVHYLDFPRYDSFIGREVGKRLSGTSELDATQLPTEDMSLWYAIDRQLAFKDVPSGTEIVLMNRSTYSNIAYQLARTEPNKRAELKEWLECLEFEVLGIPRPTNVFYFDIPLHIASELVYKKGERTYVKGKDKYEADEKMLETSYHIYKMLMDEVCFYPLECVNYDEQLRTMESLHEEVYAAIRTELE